MVWHKEDTNYLSNPDLIISLKPYVSAIVDEEISEGVLLDERNGRYWHLSSNLLRLVLALSESTNGQSIKELERRLSLNNHENLQKAINTLRIARLIRLTPRHNEFRQPPFGLVFKYAIFNLWYRILLRLRGWIPVREIRSRQLKGYSNNLSPNGQISRSSSRPEIIDEILAAMRVACAFPWVRRNCIPHSLTVYRLLVDMDYAPTLVIGSQVVPFEPHMWVELNGYRIDSGADEQSLKVFDNLSVMNTKFDHEDKKDNFPQKAKEGK